MKRQIPSPSTALRSRNDKKRTDGNHLTTAGSWLVEAAAGAVFGVVFALGLAIADFFGVTAGLVGAGLLFGCGEDALLGAAEALVSVHAFEEKLGGADGCLGFVFFVDLERCEFLEEALNLL